MMQSEQRLLMQESEMMQSEQRLLRREPTGTNRKS